VEGIGDLYFLLGIGAELGIVEGVEKDGRVVGIRNVPR
jgi:hypothetical protein